MTTRFARLTAVVAAALAIGALGSGAAAPAQAAEQRPLPLGSSGPEAARAQRQLAWLGYRIDPSNVDERRIGASTMRAANAFRAKYGYAPATGLTVATQRLLDSIAGRTGKLPRACRTQGPVICIDTRQRLLRFVEGMAVVLTTDARFGQPGERTPEGTFTVVRRARHHVSSAYRSPMPYSLFFHGGQAIHYSAAFKQDGYAGASHGCVNLRSRQAARWVFRHAPKGTPVVVYASHAHR